MEAGVRVKLVEYKVSPNCVISICEFGIHEFACSLKFVCNPQINTRCTFVAICGHAQRGKKLGHSISTFPSEVEQGKALGSAFLFLLIHFKQVYISW